MKKITHYKKEYIDLKLVLLLAGFYLLFDLVYIEKPPICKPLEWEKWNIFSWPGF